MRKDFYHKEWYDWRDEVLRYVRFRPDHGEIAKELFAHYEDSVLDFERVGYSEELARERALAAMGSAEDVGRGLDRVHKPWLGWLLEATKWLMTALCVILLGTVVSYWVAGEAYYHLQDQLKWQEPPASASRADTGHGSIYIAPGKVWEEGGAVHQRLDIWLEFDLPQTSRPNTWQLFSYTTDQGELPSRAVAVDEDGDYLLTGFYDHNADTDFYAMEGYTRYQFSVRFVTEEPLKWVEMRHALKDWTLRAEWRDDG